MTDALCRSGPGEGIFRLLVPSAAQCFPATGASPDAAPVDVAGQRWRVVDLGGVPSSDEAPAYTCVSYAWGNKSVQNPFDPAPGRKMSSRSMAVLETAIAALHPPAIWLDAACVPAGEPARTACLQNMGAIYAAAANVLVVLSPSASDLLATVRRGEPLGSRHIRLLDEGGDGDGGEEKKDDWVSRVWTYQEMVNSKIINFVVEGRTDCVNGSSLLNAIGQALAQFQRAERVDAYAFRKSHPRLDALETLVSDWLQSGYAQRSAYRIMTAMDRRTAVYSEDYFYAMVGAITSAQSKLDRAALSPSEYFIRICEEKGDFSFIYSRAPRASKDARGWRPHPEQGRLSPVVPWDNDGARQTGELHETSLRLHNMARVAPGPLDGAARAFVHDWLEKTVQIPLPPGMADAVRETLKRAGFDGRGDHIETAHGFFFAQNPLGDARSSTVFAATDVFFNFGAPGLLLDLDDSGTARFRDVGVFFGLVPTAKETVTIL